MNTSAAPDSASVENLLSQITDEFLQRLDAGEQPDIEEYAHRYPALAEVLRQVLPALQVLRGPASAANPADVATAGCLGDFRIVREIGRGGMGVVYEAEQVSLRRRVALKVLPFAATMDPRHLRRFQNEAQAAACLHHTNIVPVYSVGCERGVHFYAMQFIDGQPLNELIQQLRQTEKTTPAAGGERTVAYQPPPDETSAATPAVRAAGDTSSLTGEGKRGREYFRRVADLGVQAAEALDHAHQVGVVHRDVKPANLLLDGRGNLWVTDFGLAQVQRGEAGLTMTGDLVGTLRYMSPEQALAKRVVIDHRTDLYSLGATLYELLTLKPAFGGEDRQELLRQIAFEEPARPRRLNKTVPAELETIVLKALEKNPAERYATAKELGDDLRRFLADEPIRARRPSWVQRARKWARRHQPVVWAAAVVLLVVAVMGTAAGLWWVKKLAGAEGAAREAVEEARRLQQDEKWSEALSAARRAEGVLAGLAADKDLRRQVEQLARDLEMARRLEEARLRGAALRETRVRVGIFRIDKWNGESQLVKGVMAGDGFMFFGDQGEGESPEVTEFNGVDDRTTGGATVRRQLQRIAAQDEHFDWEGADSAYAAAFDWYGLELYALDPGEAGERIRSSSIRTQLVAALDDWAYARRKVGDAPWGPLAAAARAADPDPWRDRLRGTLGAKDSHALEELAASARGDDLSPASTVLLARLAEGTGAAGRALEVLRQVRQRHPADFWVNHELASYLSRSGPSHLEEALRYHTAAVALRPRNPFVHLSRGDALVKKGLLDEAIAEFREVIRLQKDNDDNYMNDAKKSLDFSGKPREASFVSACGKLTPIAIEEEYTEVHAKLANALKEKGLLNQAGAEHRKANQLDRSYALVHVGIGDAQAEEGKLDEAIAEYKKALRLHKDNLNAHVRLGDALRCKGRLDESIAEYHEAIRINKNYAVAHNSLGCALHDKGMLDEAIAEFREAIRINKDRADAHCNLGSALEQKGRFTEALVHRRRGHELGSKNPNWSHPSAQWVRDCERLAELDGRLPALLGGQKQPADTAERLVLARLCQWPCQKRYAAARFYREAFDAEPKAADDMDFPHRYCAARAAALAGCGQGEDAKALDAEERARLRRQAEGWLRADLAARRKLLEKGPDKDRPVVVQQMRHWLQDPGFAVVRGSESLAKLPEAERQGWRKLWEDVEALRQRAAQ